MTAAAEDRPDSAEQVRQRIADAMIDLVLEQGYESVDEQAIIARAGLSAEQFHQHFAGKEQCFIEVYEEHVQHFIDQVYGAYEGPGEWRERLRAAAYAAVRFMREYPREIRFGTFNILTASELARAHREQNMERLVDLIDDGRGELSDPDSMSRAEAQALIGSIVARMNSRLKEGTVRAPEQFVPELMYLAVLPYLGREAAEEELEIPPPPERSVPRRSR